MAEIRSTLDLIMERTKNLTLTEEEKAAFHRRELEDKVRGWVGRYREGLIGIEEIEGNMKENRTEEDLIRELLQKEILQNIDPDENSNMGSDNMNGKLLKLLSAFGGTDTEPVIRRLAAYRKDVERQRGHYADNALEKLKAKGIHGSAVIPNLEKDTAWTSWRASCRDDFMKSLSP